MSFRSLITIERCCALHGFATRDLVAVRTVSLGPSARAFSDISDDRLGRSSQLVSAVGMASRKRVDDIVDLSEEFDGALIDVETLKAQHGARVSADGRRCCPQEFVNGGVHLHVAVSRSRRSFRMNSIG